MPRTKLRYLRRKLSLQRWAPRTVLARLAVLFLGLNLLFRFLAWIGAAHSWGDSFGGWVTFLNFMVFALAGFLFLRWVRQVLMWRLRNRLIVAYVFIGVIPLALVLLMAGIAGVLFGNQFAVSVARADIDAEIQELKTLNSVLSMELARELKLRGAFTAESLETQHLADQFKDRFPGLTLTAWTNGSPTVIRSNPRHAMIVRPTWIQEDFTGLTSDAANDLDLRSFSRLRIGAIDLEVVTSAPLSDIVLQRTAAKLGEVRVYLPRSEGAPRDSPRQQANYSLFMKAGVVAPAGGSLDQTVTAASPSPAANWTTGPTGVANTVLIEVRTRASVLIARLFERQGQYAQNYIFALYVVAIVFGFIVLFALFIGVRLTKTITGSVANLYEATQHINRGDLRYRISVVRKDQLATLENSFNSMAESLERLLLEQKEKERMESELSIAQEVQAQLFPPDSLQLGTLELHGFCRPARTVSGDYYDFLKLGPERVGIAVGDISGKGISAALLMATIHSAVRAYEFGRMPEHEELVTAGAAPAPPVSVESYRGAGVDLRSSASPAEALWLLNRHLYRSTPTEQYATLFLGTFDGASRTFAYSNGGHLPPLILSEDGTVRRLETGGMVIGLFDNMEYEGAWVTLRSRDIFVAYSDGITEPENEFGEFGEERLIEIIRTHRHLPLPRISELVVAAVQDWIGEHEQPDDVTLVLARAC